ncbi:ATP-binding cassette domain-containing protein [Hydrogenovibrio marinus]|uniref:ATP-binding protein Uup n=1 Tax=Hydrogenovibrio marinus TaxID=28885 RepID=A0A066ZT54_HYDMR|nr:ATP-binding cassette domain-containing protein [Hydrogenovibrio marinus]KDN96657.1 ABC transporter ATPase [Hydrogenovibrio marinus]BBN58893.1 ABC transporter ATP-binding protein [Hydrogenovibrio marinus]
MALLFLRDMQLSYGTQTLLDHIHFQIEPNERVCIVGRNGEGKSTLLKVIEGSIEADDGSRIVQDGVKIAKLQQEVPHDMHGSVFHIISQGLGDIGELIEQFHQLSHEVAENYSDEVLDKMTKAQQKIEAADGWGFSQRVETVISKLGLPADAEFSSLSGGMKRRVLLAKALVQEPDILLLDEPTNHLDIPSIQWLEDFLKNLNCSLVFITHDRAFLQALATRIVELDRGNLSNWECDYQTYLQRKEEKMEAEAKSNAEFDKKLAQEETWIRQGIKARRTRNEGRVRALERLREEHKARRSVQGKAQLQSNVGDKSGKQVIEVENLSFAWPNQTVVQDFSTMVMRGDKVGIIGENGCGKSTLLNLLLGKLEPQSGSVKLGTNLQIAYFDQHRAQLDEEAPVIESVLEESDYIEINGQRKHVMGYLQDFLFSPERARQPVKALSGGERNRLLLARVFAKPSNLLILDEPTNDLDVETLELLEELLLNYQGTVLIVSHDRAFLNSVVTSSIVFDAPGIVNEYVGGYDDWLRQRPEGFTALHAANEKPAADKPAGNAGSASTDKPKGKKLSFNEQREYDALPGLIESLEQALEQAAEKMSEADFYQQEGYQKVLDDMAKHEAELEQAFERWEILEAKTN